MNSLKTMGQVLVLLLLFAIPVSCTVYKFNDCKKVGHSTFYCIMDMGK